MNKKIKKTIYYFFYTFLLAFLAILCVGVIFYASGYRLNAKEWKIQKTGLLIIDYPGENIELYVDNKKTKIKKNIIPHIIKAPYSVVMVPGDYDIKIYKKGMKTYTENIEIKPELITKIEDIILIPEDPEQKIILSEEMYSYSISPDGKHIVYTDKNNNINLYNMDKRESLGFIKDINTEETISSYTWSPSNDKLIIKIAKPKTTYSYLMNVKDPKNSYYMHEKFSFFPFIEEAVFSSKNPNQIFGFDDQNMYTINTKNLSVEKIRENVSFIDKENGSLYIFDKNTKDVLNFDTYSYKENIVLENSQISEDFEIIPTKDKNKIYYKNIGNIYHLDQDKKSKIIDEKVDDIFIIEKDNSFYYTKNNEIWIYDGGTEEKRLITRFGDQIKGLAKFDDKYFLYMSSKKIGIIRDNGSNNIELRKEKELEEIKIIEKNTILFIEKEGITRNIGYIKI